MTARAVRRRASDDPAAQERWGRVWVEADRRPPFKVEGQPIHPRERRGWFGGRL